MKKVKKPFLSIGIIFKNEIRCIERCVKSLMPLKELVPCEIVMADTGSSDGSREVAEKYADILFDFPWINDFSAARNAVMDRCSGTWYFSIDCDEWLDGDLTDLTGFLKKDRSYDYVALMMRNYRSLDENDRGDYSNFTAIRILRMSTGLRFEGAVHERWPSPENRRQEIMVISKCFLHHDGYANGVWNVEKSDRNMSLLKEKLKESPEDLLIMAQMVESSGQQPEYHDYIKQAVEGVKKKLPLWKRFGPPILRDAVTEAASSSMPELDEWIQMAEDWFPDSIYTKIDIEYVAAGTSWNRSDFEACIRHAETYFKGIEDYKAMRYNLEEALTNALSLSTESYQQNLLLFLLASYNRLKQWDKLKPALDKLDGPHMGPTQAENLSRLYQAIYWHSDLDIDAAVRKGWAGICKPEPTQSQADKRKERFLRNAAEVFAPDFIAREPRNKDFCRHAYGVYKALEGECILGAASAIMDTEDAGELDRKLALVEKWDELPICTLEHAILCGARFPVNAMPVEQMDRLAIRLAKDGERFDEVIDRCAPEDDFMSLAWARGLVMAAVRTQTWKDKESGMRTARRFAEIEEAFISRCYASDMLTDENIWALPPLHRFGWYCAQAFRKTDGRQWPEAVALLHKGLNLVPEMKIMVDFLLTNIEEQSRQNIIREASPELMQMAEQVKAILSRYKEDDPAVAELKASPIYQRVAWLIEDTAGTRLKGVTQ